ncbi:HAMP domain-containing histidine kinase [Halostella sp. JP-L12]|uniref:sensor histidine kinase n=1 Tax=Halostella TaxID=1843185 RepID=UPI000EF79187|nr:MULTISPECIES: ATP-binding protein [Halostella]NHN49617.1 HAMP domain-containing histidine kinase [Halostella sp. JP-L12]
MRLRTKLLVLFLLLALTTGSVVFLEFQSHQRLLIENAETDAEKQAESTAVQLDDRLVTSQQTLSVAASHPDVAKHGSDTQSRYLDSLLERTAFDGASVVAGNGTLVAIGGVDESTRRDVLGSDLSDRRYVRRALAGETHVSEPIDAETDNAVVVVSVPVRENGSVVGSLNAAIHLSNASFFSSIAGRTDETQSIAVAAGERTLYDSGGDFDDPVTGTARMDATGWTVTVSQDRAAVAEGVRSLVVQQLAPIVVAFATLFGVVAWVYRKDIKQAEKLLNGVTALERRQYDTELVLSGSSEWGELEAAFSRLAATLAERETMLLVLNRLLRHNLRNSLNVIQGRAGLLKDATDDATRRHNAEVIRETSQELIALSEKARTTEQLLVPPSEVDTSPVDLAAVVRRAVGEFRDAHPTVAFHLTAPDSASVRAGHEVEIAVEELLDNAVSHAGRDPRIDVTVKRRGDATELRVTDDGPGIPADEREVLLGEREISQLHHSGGLGLWLVGWIANRYDGEFDIESDGGTTVALRFATADGA